MRRTYRVEVTVDVPDEADLEGAAAVEARARGALLVGSVLDQATAGDGRLSWGWPGRAAEALPERLTLRSDELRPDDRVVARVGLLDWRMAPMLVQRVIDGGPGVCEVRGMSVGGPVVGFWRADARWEVVRGA